jgi:hypothetical protein
LCRVRFITDFTVDPLVDKFNFGPAVLASGFLDDGFKPPFSPVATIRFCTTFCQLAHLGFNIGDYFSPLAPSRTPACHEPSHPYQMVHPGHYPAMHAIPLRRKWKKTAQGKLKRELYACPTSQ